MQNRILENNLLTLHEELIAVAGEELGTFDRDGGDRAHRCHTGKSPCQERDTHDASS